MDTKLELRQAPFVRICLVFISGIYICRLLSADYLQLFISFSAVLFSLIAISIYLLKKKIYTAFLICILIFYSGIFACSQFTVPGQLTEELAEYGGIVSQPLIPKEKTLQVDCRLYFKNKRTYARVSKEQVRLYLAPDSTIRIPEIGDTIKFLAQFTPIRNAGNPKEFEYAKYLSNDRIYYSAYIKTGNYVTGNFSGKYWLKRIADRVQKLLTRRLVEYGFKGDELAVLSALTTGNRDLLTDDVVNNYAITGALHVLSVSGLHVGILYMLLGFLFGNRNNFLYFRIIRLIVIFVLIWFYAFITGLSSPVLRSSLMFSLFLIGKSFNRNANNYNILAASAFLLLCLNPLELFKVGFQFSYLAVFGILFFQPKIEILFLFKNGILDRVWQLIAVSLAAQLATLPVSLYYFHQFPTYFLLTNLIVIPVTWLIMMLSVLFYVSLPLNFLAIAVAFILNLLLKILNYAIVIISHWPASTISNIRFGTMHLVGWSLIILLITVYLFYRRKLLILYLSGILMMIMMIVDLINYHKYSGIREIVVYNLRDVTAISLIDGHQHIFLTSGLNKDEWQNEIKFIKPFWISRQIIRGILWYPLEEVNNIKSISDDNYLLKCNDYGSLITFNDCQILYLNPKMNVEKGKNKFQTDSLDLIIINKESGYPRNVYKNFMLPDKKVIIQNLTFRQKQMWMKYIIDNKSELHDTKEQGAFIRVFNK
jgi:competence protein ComEC